MQRERVEGLSASALDDSIERETTRSKADQGCVDRQVHERELLFSQRIVTVNDEGCNKHGNRAENSGPACCETDDDQAGADELMKTVSPIEISGETPSGLETWRPLCVGAVFTPAMQDGHQGTACEPHRKKPEDPIVRQHRAKVLLNCISHLTCT